MLSSESYFTDKCLVYILDYEERIGFATMFLFLWQICRQTLCKWYCREIKVSIILSLHTKKKKVKLEENTKKPKIVDDFKIGKYIWQHSF